jgi:hypothetical protein
MKTITLLLAFATLAICQTTFTLPSVAPGEPALPITVSATGVSNLTAWIALATPIIGWPNTALPQNTTLATALTDTTGTSVNLTASGNLAVCNGLLIDSEVMAVASTTNPVTVIRGSAGTAAATHAANAPVTILRSGNYTCWLKTAWADALTGVARARLQGAALTAQTAAVNAANAAIAATVAQVVQ